MKARYLWFFVAITFVFARTEVSCAGEDRRATKSSDTKPKMDNNADNSDDSLSLIDGASAQSKSYQVNLRRWLKDRFKLAKGEYTVSELTLYLARPGDAFPSIILSGKWKENRVLVDKPLNATRYELLQLLKARCGGSFLLDEKARVVFRGPLPESVEKGSGKVPTS